MDSTKSLVRNQTLAVSDDPNEQIDWDVNDGADSATLGDFQIRRWSPVQFSSRMPGKAEHLGEFFCSVDSTFLPVLPLVVLRWHPSRAMFAANNPKAPECSSDDAVTGTQYGACARCKFNPNFNSQLAEALKAGTPSKSCKGGYTYLCSEAWSGNLAVITLSGSSAAVGRKLNAALKTLKMGMFSGVVQLSTIKTVNDKGEFYTLAFEIVEQMRLASQVRPFAKMAESMRGVKIRETTEDDHDEAVGPVSTGNIPTGPSVQSVMDDDAIPF